jgi:DNA-directed RNA polymerase subunit RPC12/RpoP
MPLWILIPGAFVLGYVVWRLGIATLRVLAGPPPGALDTEKPPDEPEDVDDLDVYLVCGECGTEFKVSRLGELQIPRHCGEKMLVERRPRTV